MSRYADMKNLALGDIESSNTTTVTSTVLEKRYVSIVDAVCDAVTLTTEGYLLDVIYTNLGTVHATYVKEYRHEETR